MSSGPLASGVESFVEVVAPELSRLSGKPVGQHRADAAVEASNLLAGVLAADGRCTDDELWAYLEGVGTLLDPPIGATPAQLRKSRLFAGREAWLTKPSALFELLVAADAQRGGARSHRYYEASLALAHQMAAVDLVPSPAEIAAIDGFRSALLGALDAAGVARPGTHRAAPSASSVSAGAEPHATPTGPEPEPTEPLADLLAELDELVGLSEVKAEVRKLSSLLQIQRLRTERGLPTYETSHHLVFTGNPGTGKTTVARLLSRIYHSLGLVSRGHLVETDRSALVAGYVGQTATKTRAVLDAALGGTLIIDEAYALARGGENDFGREAVDTLVKFMEDHRDDLAIVVAGYPTEMHQLIETNPGLASRFTRTLHFADYSTEELVEIFARIGEKAHYVPTPGALALVGALVATEPRTPGFGNARFIRNLFEAAVGRQASRLAPLQDVSTEQLSTLIAADIDPDDASGT